MEPPGLRSIHVRPTHPDFLDLPWALPLESWRGATNRLVEMPRGLSRHEVLFVSYGTGVHALKELPEPLAEREYDLLVRLEQRDLPAVAPVGHAHVVLEDGERRGALITRFLDASLPFRTLFQSPGLERYRDRLIDAMAGLLVRLHLAGVYWGDCSLSNVLFRRDAGELRAYLVDAETSEIHDALSDGQREHDLAIMEENVEGDLADLAAQGTRWPEGREIGTGEQVRQRYAALWAEITREESFPVGETWRIHDRIRALNALGFSVGEIELLSDGDGRRLRLRTMVTDRDYHRHEFHNLTGLVAEERQAEQLLNDIREFRLQLSEEQGRSVPLSVAAFRWLAERWEPTIARLRPVPDDRGDPAEIFCQVLEHKWFLSERAQRDIGFDAALDDYRLRFPGSTDGSGDGSAAASREPDPPPSARS